MPREGPSAAAECVVTMGTAECLPELGLMYASLRAFHPEIPIVIGTTPKALALLESAKPVLPGKSTYPSIELAATGAEAAVEYLRQHLLSDPYATLVPCLAQYGAVNRARMERQPGVWFPTRHCDFMMEKANLMDLALQRGAGGALFVDCDMLFTAPLPPVPTQAVVGVSEHEIGAVDQRLFGVYNGGWMYARDPAVLFEWRRATHVSRYFDQASIEDVVKWAGPARTHAFPRTTNFGYWRMFQAPEGPAAVARTFAAAPGSGRVEVGGSALQSVHTHFFMPTGSRAVPIFNRLVASWCLRSGIAKRTPAWAPVATMISDWARVSS